MAKKDDQSAFGRLVAELRKKKGITQAALAEMVEVGASAIGLYESGRAAPSEDKAKKIIDALTRDKSVKDQLWEALTRQSKAYYEARPFTTMGWALRAILDEYQITRADFSEAVGLRGQQLVQFWLDGFRAPAGDRVKEIVKYLKRRGVPDDRIREFRAARIKDMILADSSFSDLPKAELEAVAQAAYDILIRKS